MDRYEMRLFPRYFEELKRGNKRIEIRCNDNKRKMIKEGDIIEFSNASSGEKIITLVKSTERCNSFDELVYRHLPREFGFQDMTHMDVIKELRKIYSEEEEQSLGVVGIEIEKM